MFHRWRKAGPGPFLLHDGVLIVQPGGDHSVLFYAPEAFNDLILRLQFRLPGPVDSFGKTIGNSGVFLRFRYPHTQWAGVNQHEPEPEATLRGWRRRQASKCRSTSRAGTRSSTSTALVRSTMFPPDR